MIIYLLIINVIGFFAMWYDKGLAKTHRYRVPEGRLLLIALIGGAAGVLIGMQVFNHKTKHLKFSLGIPVIFIAQVILFKFLH
ncbi:MAG: DUF1294 domain-containing protein [Desulfotomaculaceae bacterium]|nr:DUF1294 domain-containing protein [Desulfotomaculaceae bacterium]